MSDKRSLKEWEEDFEASPVRVIKRLFWMGVACLPVFMLIGVGLRACGFFTGAVNNGVAVARKEFYPDALLRKYEWFKDAAAALDSKQASIALYQKRLRGLADSYVGMKRPAWARDDREEYNLWSSELAGIRASYNDLAAEYNAQMAKFNWRFTNVGDLPPGASNPLPREYKPYQEGE